MTTPLPADVQAARELRDKILNCLRGLQTDEYLNLVRTVDGLVYLVNQARRDEREACAKVADESADRNYAAGVMHGINIVGTKEELEWRAGESPRQKQMRDKAIRARGK